MKHYIPISEEEEKLLNLVRESNSYQVTLIIAMTPLALPIILEAISGLSLVLGGEIFCFNSAAIKTWVKYIAPVLLLSLFIPYRIKLKGIKLKENAIILN